MPVGSMTIGAVDRIRITTVVDNYIDNLRQDDAVARRYSAFVAGKMPDLRGERRVCSGRLSRDEIERYEVAVRLVAQPTPIVEGMWLSGEMHATEEWETSPSNLRVEENGELIQDTFIGEQALVANVRDRGLVVVTSCSHRGIVGICRNAVRITGVPRVHAVIGGFHLSGLEEARITRVVDAFRALDVEHLVPQHCTGIEAICAVAQRVPGRFTASSVGTTFEFAAPN